MPNDNSTSRPPDRRDREDSELEPLNGAIILPGLVDTLKVYQLKASAVLLYKYVYFQLVRSTSNIRGMSDFQVLRSWFWTNLKINSVLGIAQVEKSAYANSVHILHAKIMKVTCNYCTRHLEHHISCWQALPHQFSWDTTDLGFS